jgi:hypothetical protein
MRERDKNFVRAVIARAAGGELSDELIADAYRESHGLGRRINDEETGARVAAFRAKEKLKNPNIREALQEFYEEASFDVLQAAEMHVAHIKGGLKKQVLNAEGEVVEIEMPPNYKALADYLKITIPQPAVKVDKRVLIGHVNRPSNDPPKITARSISTEQENIAVEDEAEE